MSAPPQPTGAEPPPPALSPAKAALLERWRRGAGVLADVSAIRPRAGRGPAPLSLAQQRLWFLERFQPGTAAYNLFFCASVEGRLDPDLLAASVEDLVDRHQTLRTTFAMCDGTPCQTLDAGARPALETADLTGMDPDASRSAAVERMDAAIHRPFDLSAGPLARVMLWRGPTRDVLGLVIHHLVADGWSLGVALAELSILYEARAGGRKPSLPPLTIQYGDFAAWQRDQASSQDWELDLAHWRDRFRGLPPLELPTDRSRPPVISLAGDWRELRLTRELSDGLRALAHAENATLFMVVLAALHVLLYRLSGQPDLTVGTATANRTRGEAAGLIGNFVNMLALRTDIRGARTFREVVGRVRMTCLEAFAHQRVPFERMVEEVQPARDPSRSILFQVLLVLQPPTTQLRFAGRPLALIELGSRTARADLELHLWDHPAIVGRIAFSTDLFDVATIERLLERLRSLLRECVADPDRRLPGWSILLPEEREALGAWGRGPRRHALDERVHEMVHRQAVRSPRAPAVLCGEQRVTYAELDGRANRLAHHLHALGAGPEVRVAVCLERSADMLVAVLGVLKAGGAYVPLDPGYPPDRLAFMVGDARARLVVTTLGLSDRLRVPGATIVCLDGDRDAIDSRPGAEPAVRVHPDNLAYVIYTSGSTGRPKGVQIAHRALENLVLSMRERPGLGSGDVVATVASLSFDASVAELFPALATGATVVVAEPEDVIDGSRLRALVVRRGVTFLQATATTWRLLLRAGGLEDRRIRALCGGEATPLDVQEALAAAHDEAWNMYGPTEATVWATAERMSSGGPVSLGSPLANTRVHLVDEDLERVAVGSIGELCIGGAGLSRGYLDRPALTALRFVPDPFGDEPGARLYRTGDLARYRAGGALEFVGRLDDQVKLRGHRIELGEIESNLVSHPAVEQAVVVLDEGAAGDSRLVAYVVLGPAAADREAPTGPELARHLRDRLPTYMVPSAFVFLAELPTTPTGKVDRRQLPEPHRTRPGPEATYVAPRTPLELAIATLVADLLGLERVGVRDDFFELGGHSLLGAELITELQQRHEVEVPVQELFLAPTVEHLAAQVEAGLARERLFSSREERLRGVVDRLPDAMLDSMLAELARGDAHQR